MVPVFKILLFRSLAIKVINVEIVHIPFIES